MYKIKQFLAQLFSVALLVLMIAGIGVITGFIYGMLEKMFSAGRSLFL